MALVGRIWRDRLIDNIMDKATKHYIDQATAPLHARIETLEKSNEELRALVKHLEALICYERHYQKPTSRCAAIQSQPPTT